VRPTLHVVWPGKSRDTGSPGTEWLCRGCAAQRQNSSTWSASTSTQQNGLSSLASTRKPRCGPRSPPAALAHEVGPGRNHNPWLQTPRYHGPEVLYDTRRSHNASDVLAFFKLIDAYVPRHLEVHVVFDNRSAHKAEPIAPSLAHRRRTRWHLHFTPTSPSCLNRLEGRLSFLTQRRLGPGVLSSVHDLLTAIETSAEHWNYDPESFVSKNPTDAIVSKAKRGRSTLASVKSATHHYTRPHTRERPHGDTS
jgi:predicted Fe-S protein YdhL (DUF1289 family)